MLIRTKSEVNGITQRHYSPWVKARQDALDREVEKALQNVRSSGGIMHSPKPLVIFVVGHERWGKSHTFRALFGKPKSKRRTSLEGVQFWLRRTSNDDISRKHPDRYKNFIDGLLPSDKPYVIAALCPKFKGISESDNPNKFAEGFLKSLQRKGYRLNFWVLLHQWKRPERMVLKKEISVLNRYAKGKQAVEIYRKQNPKARDKKAALGSFISGVIRRSR